MPRRLRTNIFNGRQQFVLRIPGGIHAQLLKHCETQEIAANTFVISAVSAALDKADTRVARTVPGRSRADKKVSMTVRLPPELHERMIKASIMVGISATALACGAIEASLRREEGAT
jgi:predicted HicB family RNase H-like nuclease